jgi:hypothetical protein
MSPYWGHLKIEFGGNLMGFTKKMGMTALALTLSMSGVTTAKAAEIFTLKLFHIDDAMKVDITNSFYLGQNILNVGFGNSHPEFDITPYVKKGQNTLDLRLYNGPAGWTYGYDFKRNGVTVSAEDCGTFNIYGCNKDEYKQGLVWTKSINFTAYEDGSVPSVPEPASWALMLIGFGFAGYSLRRRNPSRALTSMQS